MLRHGDLTDWLTLVAGALAFGFGYVQYRKAESWKKAEFLAGEMKAFFADPDVTKALMFIDYSRIRLDKNGRPVEKGEAREGEVETEKKKDGSDFFDDAIMTKALADHKTFPGGIESFNRQEMIARGAWDAFFTGLERFSSFEQSHLITTDDLKPYLEYWIRNVGDVNSEYKDPEFYVAVHQFVDGYGYVGVRKLFTAFHVPPPPTIDVARSSSSVPPPTS